MAKFTPEVEAAIRQASQQYGVPESRLRAFAAIESGGNPRNQTGSYLGLFQLSQNEFRKHGGQGNIFDPVANANAAAIKLKSEEQDFARRFGRAPTDGELYMIHQQGVGGSAAHAANPDAPAWRNMASTSEGRQKGEGWARQAIWGNVPDDVKRQFGSVDNLTSKQFTDMWNTKVARFGGNATPAAPASSPAPSMDPSTLEPAPTAVSAPTAVASGPAGVGGYGGHADQNEFLTAWAKQFDESQQNAKEAEARGARAGAQALGMAKSETKAAPSAVAQPNKVNVGQLLAALKARGVNTIGAPGLGTDEKTYLGTRGA